MMVVMMPMTVLITMVMMMNMAVFVAVMMLMSVVIVTFRPVDAKVAHPHKGGFTGHDRKGASAQVTF